MDDRRLILVSKYLSRILRHAPSDLGLELEVGGWVRIDDLRTGASQDGFIVSHEELEQVVSGNDKQRFSIDPTGERIRANQGHSVNVNLELEATLPPEFLYHGTAQQSVAAILARGLLKMRRHHVHLSAEVATASKVGARHGRPVVFEVAATAMAQADFTFFRSANGVWLVEHVPPQYLSSLGSRDAPSRIPPDPSHSSPS